MMHTNDHVHPHLIQAFKKAYDPLGLTPNNLLIEPESQEYGAMQCIIAHKRILFRIGKITPTKLGLFTTIWKRIGSGPILPYDTNDPFDLYIISVQTENRLGHFLFTKDILAHMGYLSQNGIGGKRAIRIYPPWVTPENVQARKTQNWQLPYFAEILPHTDYEAFKIAFKRT